VPGLTNFLRKPLDLRVCFDNFFAFLKFAGRNLGLRTSRKLFNGLHGASTPFQGQDYVVGVAVEAAESI